MDHYRCFLELVSGVDISEAHAVRIETWSQDHCMPEILYKICQKVTQDKLRWLINFCPSITSSDAEGTTALMLAAQEANLIAAQALLQAGIDVAQTDNLGNNALVHVIHYINRIPRPNYLQVAVVLIEAGIPINHQNSNLETPLHMVIAGFPPADMVSLLLFYNADVTATDRNGNTPLMLACHNPRFVSVELIAMLIAYGSDCNHRNHIGDTPITTFAGTYVYHVVDALAYLINHGADYTRKNPDGHIFTDLIRHVRRCDLEEIISLVECPDKRAQLMSIKMP